MQKRAKTAVDSGSRTPGSNSTPDPNRRRFSQPQRCEEISILCGL